MQGTFPLGEGCEQAALAPVQCPQPKADCRAPLRAPPLPGETTRGKKAVESHSGPLIPESLKGTSNEIEWQAV